MHDGHKFISSRFRADVGARLGGGERVTADVRMIREYKSNRVGYGLYDESIEEGQRTILFSTRYSIMVVLPTEYPPNRRTMGLASRSASFKEALWKASKR